MRSSRRNGRDAALPECKVVSQPNRAYLSQNFLLSLMKYSIRPMTIDDYDEVYRLWEQTEGLSLEEGDCRNGIEIYHASEAFTLAESVFYGLNILFLGTVSGQFIMMGMCDLCCRWIAGRRGQGERNQGPAFAVIACLFGMTGIYFVLLWREGAGLMYLFVQVYKALFV